MATLSRTHPISLDLFGAVPLSVFLYFLHSFSLFLSFPLSVSLSIYILYVSLSHSVFVSLSLSLFFKLADFSLTTSRISCAKHKWLKSNCIDPD